MIAMEGKIYDHAALDTEMLLPSTFWRAESHAPGSNGTEKIGVARIMTLVDNTVDRVRRLNQR